MKFDPDEILRILVAHGVDFIVVGGLAATFHGSSDATFDADVVPEESERNLERLSDALTELDAKIRVGPDDDGIRFNHDGKSLARSLIWNLVTPHGALDVIFRPGGTAGYVELRGNAVAIEVRGISLVVASLDDVIRTKEAAGRDKDLRRLPALRVLRDEVRRRETPP